MLEALDRTIQRFVDSAAFALMRTFGVFRSAIVYAVGAILVVAAVGSMVIPNSGISGFGKAMTGIMVLLFLVIMHFRHRNESNAEQKGMTHKPHRQENGLWKVVFAFYGVTDALQIWYPLYVTKGTDPTMVMFYHGLQSVIAWCFVLLEYLDRTPNVPPPSRKRVWVPARQQA